MSKSLGNYIGINEPPSEIFGKVMSISDDLMWRYHELLTDLTVDQIAGLRRDSDKGERNPRDIKAELAKSIISDFHSVQDAKHAEEEFNRVFRSKQRPEEVEERAVPFGNWELKALLVTLELAASKAEARRLIEQGGVYVEGQRCDAKTSTVLALTPGKPSYDLKVGKRRFVRIRGE